jgi:hypothetical protein
MFRKIFAAVFIVLCAMSTDAAIAAGMPEPKCGPAYKQCRAKCLKDEKESPFTPEAAHRAANQCNVACIGKYCTETRAKDGSTSAETPAPHPPSQSQEGAPPTAPAADASDPRAWSVPSLN